LTFVKDTVQGFIKVAENDEAIGKILNLGAGKGITIGDLAKLILQLAEVDKPIVHEKVRDRPPESEVFELVADNSQAKKVLSWRPLYSLKEGLAATIDFVSEHPYLFKVGEYAI
jgi:dTDP-glucose 4,6-dehydratase